MRKVLALLFFTFVFSCGSAGSIHFERVYRARFYALRLHPGDDLRKSIESFAAQHGLRAAYIATAVGSLRSEAIRLADQKDSTKLDGKMEIVSLVGTIAGNGVHLHISLSDATGRTIGGHLTEGCIVNTTAEIVIGEIEGMRFTREDDPETGYKELVVE